MRFVICYYITLSLLLAMVLGKDFHLNLARYTAKSYPLTVLLDVGSIFSVSLQSNPTTGYSWATYEEDLKDSGLLNVIEYLDEEYTQNPHSRIILGRGGVTKLRFKIIGVGKGMLNLFYAQ